MITHAFSFFLLAVWEGVRPWEDSIDGCDLLIELFKSQPSMGFLLLIVHAIVCGRAYEHDQLGLKPKRRKRIQGDQRSNHFFFHLIVLLQENDEKKKDDRDLSLDSHHWLLSSSCWPKGKGKETANRMKMTPMMASLWSPEGASLSREDQREGWTGG